MDKDKDEASFLRSGAEFIMTDLDLAFTFLDIASTSQVADTGRAVHDATVVLIPKDQWHSSIVSIRSGEDGQFHIDSGIALGKYSILALAGLVGGEEQDPDFIRDQVIRATPLVLDKNETKSITLLVRYAAH